MRTATLLPFALSVGACRLGDGDVHYQQSGVYRGSVRDVGTGEVLTTFCAQQNELKASRIVFAARAGARIQEEVLYETLEESFTGGVPPERDEAFWCSGAPRVTFRPAEYWLCLRGADSDPPATLVEFQQRGDTADDGSSSGYALTLDVRHAGILRLAFDAKCILEHSPGLPDSIAPPPQPELTIQ